MTARAPTPLVAYAPEALTRQYPHVDTIEDWRAQQSIRLLWDRTFNLEARLQASERTMADVVKAVNTMADELVRLRQLIGESLAPSTLEEEVAEGGCQENEFGIAGTDSAMPTVALPDLSGIVAGFCADNPTLLADSCLSYGGGSWAFMEGLVAALQAEDPRCGFNGKRGNVEDPSQDAIAYYHGEGDPTNGSNDVYVVDVLSCHCGAEEGADCTVGPAWNDVTDCVEGSVGAWIDSIGGGALRLGGVATALHQRLVPGAPAGALVVPGLTPRAVVRAVTDLTALVDLTAEFTVTATDTLDNAGGTDTTGHTLQVWWVRR